MRRWWQRWDLNPGNVTLEFVPLTTTPYCLSSNRKRKIKGGEWGRICPLTGDRKGSALGWVARYVSEPISPNALMAC